jgi:hypothetical protein
MTLSTTIKIVYTLQKLHNFTHRLVILSPVGDISLLPNIHFIRCTARRSPQSISQCFSARRTGKTMCYSTEPTHISHVLYVVNMVTCFTNWYLIDLSKD